MSSIYALIREKQGLIEVCNKKIKEQCERIVKSLASESVNWTFEPKGSPPCFHKTYHAKDILFNDADCLAHDGHIFQVIKIAETSHIWGVFMLVKSRTMRQFVDRSGHDPVTFFNYDEKYGITDLRTDLFSEFELIISESIK